MLIALIVQVGSAIGLLMVIVCQLLERPGSHLGHYPWWSELAVMFNWTVATLIKRAIAKYEK